MRLLAFPLVLVTLFGGCIANDPNGDGVNDSFPSGKADGGVDPGSIEAAGVLAVVNNSFIGVDELVTQVGLSELAATNIVAHRNGPDGSPWTADNDLFDNLAELDAVPNVGPLALSKLVAYAEAHGFMKRWANRANMTAKRGYLGAVRGADGRVYAIGGDGTISAEAYTPATDTWTTLAPMPTPRYGHATAVGADGTIYAIGGYNTVGTREYHNVVEAYTPSTDTWQTLAPMPTMRALHSAVSGPDGRIYVIGGYNEDHGTLTTVEIYTPSTDTWSTGASMPSARYNLATAVGNDGKIYAFGGTYENDPLQTVEAYDPATNRWTSLDKMPIARVGLSAVTGSDGLIYLFGGNTSYDLHTVTHVSTFDAATKQWSSVQDNLVGRVHFGAAQGGDGRFYVVGGYEPPHGSSASVEAFTPKQ